MTNETQETPTSGSNDTAQPVSEAIRDAVESSRDTADQVRQIVVDLFSGKRSPVTSARDAIHGMLQTASEIANRSAPDKAESVVKNVIDGIGTGLKSVAQTTQDAVQDATARGQRFASEDVERAPRSTSRYRPESLRCWSNPSSRVPHLRSQIAGLEQSHPALRPVWFGPQT